MTILLIVAIVFLIVWWKDSNDKKTKAKEYQESTKTNVELELQLYDKWISIIDNKLKSNNSSNPFEALMSLYDKYDIPKQLWNEDDDALIVTRELFEKDFLYIQDEYSKLDVSQKQDFEIIIFIQHAFRKWKSGYESPIVVECTAYKIYESGHSFKKNHNELWKSISKEKALDEIEQYRKERIAFEQSKFKEILWGTNIKVECSTPNDYCYVILSGASFQYYCHLIRRIVCRELYTQGYKPSPNLAQRKESIWQESEKSTKRFREQKKKYPWL